ncbi:MAG: hypothetical protein HY711_07365, partial [Candidatus Melainabacteria bacterium]|nr:hypothetical protein [Candidatus Melainabacteria bacterium]
IFRCSRISKNGACDHIAFPDDFMPPFSAYKAGKYVWKTMANSEQVDKQYFDCIVKSNSMKPAQVQDITILMPGI